MEGNNLSRATDDAISIKELDSCARPVAVVLLLTGIEFKTDIVSKRTHNHFF